MPTDDAWIDNLVGVFTDPTIVYPGGWGDDLPDWLKTAITMERLVENMKATKGEQLTATDAEATVYLYTASLVAPMSESWHRIYFYVAGRAMARAGKDGLPDDLKVESLDSYDTGELHRLKDWLYRQRIRAREEKAQAQRRQQKEEAAARQKALTPRLFDL